MAQGTYAADNGLSAAPATGWPGRYFEDLTIGDVYRHSLGRTVLTVRPASRVPW
jgi:hypothetical protein